MRWGPNIGRALLWQDGYSDILTFVFGRGAAWACRYWVFASPFGAAVAGWIVNWLLKWGAPAWLESGWVLGASGVASARAAHFEGMQRREPLALSDHNAEQQFDRLAAQQAAQ